MHSTSYRKSRETIFLLILAAYAVAICCINFSMNPNYYDTDMYADILYARLVAQEGTIFPSNWVFGNQLYAIATPVLAAVFSKFLDNPYLPMAFATTIMSLGVLLSFDWMIRLFIPNLEARLGAAGLFLTLPLLCGDAYFNAVGWQLLFTMCSYYSCYAISAFLSFGCYLRSNSEWTTKFRIMLAVACIFSLGTGVQSIRQTAIMVCPVIGMELLAIAARWFQKKPVLRKSTAVSGLILVSNFLGLILAKVCAPAQVTIFGAINRQRVAGIISGILPAIQTILSVVGTPNLLVLALVVCVFFLLLAFGIFDSAVKKNSSAFTCILLHLISIAVIFAIDLGTTMQVRNIYYFMFYPLVVVLASICFNRANEMGKSIFAVVLLSTMVVGCAANLQFLFDEKMDADKYQMVVDYLEEEGITTIYSGWNQGEKIALTSGMKVRVAFCDDPFEYVTYLCEADLYDSVSQSNPYVFIYGGYADWAVERANAVNAEFNLIQAFDSCGASVYTSPLTIQELCELVLD